MDTLCDDLKRSIVGYLDPLSVGTIETISKEWQIIANDSKVHYRGSVNSTIFTYQGLLYHGPVYMAHVLELDLSTDVFVSVDASLLRAGIEALQLPSVLRNTAKNLSVKVNPFSWHILKDILIELSTISTFNSLDITGAIDAEPEVPEAFKKPKKPLTTTSLTCGAQSYLALHVNASKLYLVDDIYSTSLARTYYDLERQALIKAFSSSIDFLSLYGPCMHDSLVPLLPVSKLKTLVLHVQTNRITWANAAQLQRRTPNLESFTLRASNIICSDLEGFHWPLWPCLKSLDLSLNYSLHSRGSPGLVLPKVPRLRLHGTHILPSDLDAMGLYTIEDLSISADTTEKTIAFLRKCPLKKLRLSVNHYLHGYHYETRADIDRQFWLKLNVPDIIVKFSDYFYHASILEQLKKQCAHIQKCNYTDFLD